MSRMKNGRVHRPKAPTQSQCNILNLIANGARLERTAGGVFWIGDRRLPASLGRSLLERGLVNSPPALFGLDGGGLTQLGRAEVNGGAVA